MQAYHVERVNPEDVEQVAPLFEAYRAYYRQTADAPGAQQFLQERLEAGESVLFMAVPAEGADNSACGFAHLYPSFSSLTMQKLWILNDLFVAEELRGHGIGSLLLAEVGKFAEETGTKGLTLNTMTDNAGAQKLYEAQGYVRDDEFYTYNLFF